MAVHIGEAAVDAVVADGESFVVDAELVKERGVMKSLWGANRSAMGSSLPGRITVP